MSDDRVPAPVEALIRAVAGGDRDETEQRATAFARGLAIGALVGAAIAGSTIWQRRHARHDATTTAPEPTPGEPASGEPSQTGP